MQGWEFEVICVNDGSTDNTSEILNSFEDIVVINHPVNRGYGAALKTGLAHCKSTWVFITDADNTYPIEELPRFLKECLEGYEMVVGERKGIGISKKPLHRIARWILRKMTHVLSGTMVPDLNSGMRVFKLSLYDECKNLLPTGFSFTTTLTMAALYKGYRIKYLPINYSERTGTSSIKPFKDFFSFIMLIIRIATYFEPLRFFLPLSFSIGVVGFLKALRDFIILGQIGPLSVTIMLTAVQIFTLGVIAELIVKRTSTEK